MTPKLKSWLVLALIFLLGIGTGALLAIERKRSSLSDRFFSDNLRAVMSWTTV